MELSVAGNGWTTPLLPVDGISLDPKCNVRWIFWLLRKGMSVVFFLSSCIISAMEAAEVPVLPLPRREKNSSSVAFHIVSIFFVGRKRCQQLSNLQSHRHKPMEQVILVRSLLAIWFSQTFFHPFLLILRRSNLAEKLAGSWSRLPKKLNMKDHLSSFLPLLHLLFVVDFAHLSKEFIVHCIASRNIMKPVAWHHHSCMLCWSLTYQKTGIIHRKDVLFCSQL